MYMSQTKNRTQYHKEYRARKRKEAQAAKAASPKRSGRQQKGADISENFNFTKALAPSAAELKRIKDIFELPPPPVAPFPDMTPEIVPEGLDKNAYQMLEDMRHAYRHGGGRKKLGDFAQADDRNFVFLVKELMKIEAALLSAKIRRENTAVNSANQQNFFVVIKGLEDGPAPMVGAMGDGVDFARIQRAVDPTFVGRNDADDDPFKDANDAPDMLFGVKDNDPWEGLDD